ncbi:MULTISPECIES: hypothetical protein [Okeania]|uniref:hypothetical protein n=1 Tax=Okeania TaxID=1458928 RepID=UPI001374E7F7|nr:MULTISPECIES: hypothetical protein [Okeania]NEP08033.1 hypothetical protein [Okeania sp. SIO4D6]NEP40239.1 hypothetical protein [Okeania sp. SIO2H7]NET15485.1 hypothetical protein [Okeania sp. SIO1H6]NEP75075.1 hypothetical protein [Okeania sp. SIO2G5]NEP86534.1 hypothetical protein [Okeania sp. SIO2C2]
MPSVKSAFSNIFDYVETANFFANICRKPNGQLIYIGGQKANPENAIKIPAIAE